MRLYTVIICAVLAVTSLAACTPNTIEEAPPSSALPEAPSSQSAPSSVPLPEPEPKAEFNEAPAAELTTPGEITVYKIDPESGIFGAYKFAVEGDGITLLDIATAVENQMEIIIPIRGITQQKGMVIVDLDQSFIESYSDAKAEQILNTLAATLRQNHASFEWIQYQQNGEVGIFGEMWEIPPLKLIEGSSEEFDAIRAAIPYEGLQLDLFMPNELLYKNLDEKNLELTRFVTMLGLMRADISSPTELKNEHLLETALRVTKHYSSAPFDAQNYKPELKAFEAPASEILGLAEDWFWLREHIEQSIKLLYGSEIVPNHEDYGKYRYIAELGVYTPPHMGEGYGIAPVIFSYEDLGDRYRLELAYIVHSMGGYFDPDGQGIDWDKPIPEASLKQYVETKSKRREIILNKTDDGGLTFFSHKYI